MPAVRAKPLNSMENLQSFALPAHPLFDNRALHCQAKEIVVCRSAVDRTSCLSQRR